LASLQEGIHYIVCHACGAFQAQITTKHLHFCTGLDLGSYLKQFPGAPILSNFCSKNKAKTEEQKEHQSRVLLERFQRPEGLITKQVISRASKRMQAGAYGIQARAFLQSLSQSPIRRAQISQQMHAQYATGWNPARAWHANHREESLLRAAYARRFILRKRTKLHMGFKEALDAAGLRGFQTEYEVDYYALDEARPDLQIAVEIDGCYWHGCPDCGFPGVFGSARHDKLKEAFLRNRGWIVLRFRGCQVHNNLALCLAQVKEAITLREVLNVR